MFQDVKVKEQKYRFGPFFSKDRKQTENFEFFNDKTETGANDM